jgi:hypothetical protein
MFAIPHADPLPFGQPFSAKTYAAWPCRRDSTTKNVKFQGMTKKQAVKIWHEARRFERATRQPGRQDGVVTRNGLAALHSLLFDFLNYASGRLMPSHAAIASKAAISERSVRRGLVALKKAGIVNWIRRCIEEFVEGRFTLRQESNAYAVLPPTQWQGFAFLCPPKPAAPQPEAGTWGDHPALPDPLTQAVATAARGGPLATILDELESDPRDSLAKALAKLGRGFLPRLL